MDTLKSLYSKIKADKIDYYTMALVTIGLPLIAFIYFDWRAAVTTFIISHIILGVSALRANR